MHPTSHLSRSLDEPPLDSPRASHRGRRARHPLAPAALLLAALVIGFLEPACNDSKDSPNTTGVDAQNKHGAIASDVARATVRVLRRLDRLVRLLQQHPARKQIIHRLTTVEQRARRLAQEATRLPEITAIREPLIALNRTAARTASSIREITRLSEIGQIKKARSIALSVAAELRHSIEQLRSRLPQDAKGYSRP